MPLQPGSLLADRYRIEDKLGRGGMGAVYLAYDQTLNLRVAVKENLNPNPEAGRQFKKEAELLAKLRHPHLPRVTDYFILGDQQYLVMDYIEGIDLHARAAQAPPTVEEVVAWANDLAGALGYLHRQPQPIIHRDIKPSNVKVQPDGTLFLVDFGIAKVFEGDQAATTTGARGLTPGFSPPEQYGGARTDARSDQFALAATLYALMTGHSPPDSIERMLNKEHLRPASSLNPKVPPHIDAALERAMSIDMEDRFPDLATFQAALNGRLALETIRAPAREAAVPVPPRAAARRPALLLALGGAGLAGLLLLAGGGALALGLIGGSEANPTATAAAPVVIEITSTSPPASPTARATPEPSVTAEPSPTASPAPLLGGGGRIVFVSDRESRGTMQVWTMNPDGSDPLQLTFGPGSKSNPRWSHDGRWVLYSASGGRDQFNTDLGLDLFVIGADGSGEQNLTRSPGADTEGAWSPVGGTIAFTSTRGNELGLVYIMAVDCPAPPGECNVGQAQRITMDPNFPPQSSPAWSPDGGQIAVIAKIRGALGRIYIGASGGGGSRFDRSDNIIGADQLDWSPLGDMLAFTWFQPGFNEVYVVPLNDPRSPKRLTFSAGNKHPAFSPDGLFLAYTGIEGQNPEIFVMTSAGANATNLTNNPARDEQPDWQPYLP
jgi:Tol biopolymer transport system component